MTPELREYLVLSYRREVLHEDVRIPMVDDVSNARNRGIGDDTDSAMLEGAKKELARINALKLGSNLANRDYASYHAKRSLERLIKKMEDRNAARANENQVPEA